MTEEGIATPADELIRILDALDKYLRTKGPWVGERAEYDRWSKQWKRDAGLHPGALRPLLDPSLLPGLVTVKYPGGTGSAFFLPVVAAWIVLGLVELRYAASGSRESFFIWWTEQGILGPYVYSFVIAGVLLFALFLQVGRTAATRLAEEVDARLTRDAAAVAAAVGQLLDAEAEARPAATDRASLALTRAADRLGGVADALQLDREAIKEYTTAAAHARASIATLSGLTEQLTETTSALAVALVDLPTALRTAAAQVVPIRDALEDLNDQAVDLQRQSDTVAGHLETLVTKVLPTTALSAEKAVGAASLAASSAPALAQAAAALTAAYQQLGEHQRYSAELVDKAQKALAYIEEGPNGAGGHEVWPAR